MKLLLALFLFSTSSAFAIDTGDGSDGVCTNASFSAIKRNYQCTSLTINAPLNLFRYVGGAQVVIKVQNDINITGAGSIDLSGHDGLDGTITAVNGGAGGAGGNDGGASRLTNDGLSGIGSGLGTAGKYSADLGGSYGGGGGGGSFRTKDTDEAEDGFDSGGQTASKGANGSAFFTTSAQFDSSFTGGSGGGAGGAGFDGVATNDSGSSGGGGGGAIHLVAGGNIVIDGSVIANGGNGGGSIGTSNSGGGGGGSGGAIWIQAAGILTVNGTITAAGGAGGTNDFGTGPGTGHGGDGGMGAIRLDDSSGTPVNTGTVDAGYFHTVFVPTAVTTGTNAVSRQYTSGVSCGSVALDENEKPYNNLVNLILGMAIAALLHFAASRKSKV